MPIPRAGDATLVPGLLYGNRGPESWMSQLEDCCDLSCACTAASGSSGSADDAFAVFLYRPGGPLGHNIFDTFVGAYNAAIASGLPATIYFDASYAPLEITAGDYDLSTLSLLSVIIVPGGGGNPVALRDGVHITFIPRIVSNLSLQSHSSTPILTLGPTAMPPETMLLREGGELVTDVSATAPFVEITPGGIFLVVLELGARIESHGAQPVVLVDAGATFLVLPGESTNISASSIAGAGTAVAQSISPSASIDASQPGLVPGPFQIQLLSLAANVNYDDGLVPPPLGSNNVQGAIDALKGGGYLIEPSVSALGFVNAASFPFGKPAFTQDLLANWVYDPNSNAPVDGITVINAGGGPPSSRWLRQVAPNPQWQTQATWFLSNTGDDTADGATAGTPIRTWAELRRRVGEPWTVLQDTVVTVMNNAVDVLEINAVPFTGTESLTIQGVPVAGAASLVTATTPMNPPADQPYTAFLAAPVAVQGEFMRLQGDGTYLYAASPVGGLGFLYSSPIDPTGVGGAYPIPGQTMEHISLPQVAVRRATGVDSRFLLSLLNIVGADNTLGMIEQARIFNCIVQICLVRTVFTANLVASGGRLDGSNTLTSGSLRGQVRLSGYTTYSLDGYMEDAISESGKLEVNSTFTAPTGTVLVECGGELFLNNANALYGQGGDVRLEPGATITATFGSGSTIAAPNSLVWPNGAVVAIPPLVPGAVVPAAVPCTTLFDAFVTMGGQAIEPASLAKVALL